MVARAASVDIGRDGAGGDAVFGGGDAFVDTAVAVGVVVVAQASVAATAAVIAHRALLAKRLCRHTGASLTSSRPRSPWRL
jgi:hypothetical protein